MKSKIVKKIIKIILIILIIIGVFFLGRKSGLTAEVSNTTTTITEEAVEKRTLKKELSSSGQIQTASTEKLVPSTSKYFKTMCVEADDTISEGDNILQYSDGTYMMAQYDCVVNSYSMPETGSKCTSSNYVEVQTLENLVMTISVNENQINYIKKEQEVTVVPTIDTSKTYTGKVSKIESIGTYQSSGTTYTATIAFENDGNLKIGMSASCTILLEEVTDVLAVPINAVQTNNEQKYVIVVNENGTTENVNIETGISNDDYVEVKSGLSEGQKVQVVTTTTTSTTRNSGSQNGQRGFSGGAMQGAMSGESQMENRQMTRPDMSSKQQ